MDIQTVRTIVFAIALGIGGAFVGCACTQETKPEIPPGPKLPEGDGLGTPIGDMCANLRSVRCPEGEPRSRNGKTRTCYQAQTMANDVAPLPVACVTKAPTREAVRACGDPNREVTFRCVAP